MKLKFYFGETMTTQHILKPFDKDLGLVHDKVLGMAEMVYRELSDSLQAFSDRDQDAAADAKAADRSLTNSKGAGTNRRLRNKYRQSLDNTRTA